MTDVIDYFLTVDGNALQNIFVGRGASAFDSLLSLGRPIVVSEGILLELLEAPAGGSARQALEAFQDFARRNPSIVHVIPM